MQSLTAAELPLAEPKRTVGNRNLSKDGRWRVFPKVPNLLQYVSTSTYFARVKVNGKIVRQSLDTKTFTTAKLLLTDFLKEQRAKKRFEGAATTFAEAQKLYEQDLEADYTLSPNAKRYREYCLKKLNTSWPQLGALKLDRIPASECKLWASRLAQELEARYFNNVLGTFRLILRRVGVSDDPSREVKKLGVKPTRLQLPEPDQFLKMLTAIESSGAGQAQQCADLVRFLAFSGCRISEAQRVRWCDVNLSKGTITVHSAKVRRSNSSAPTRVVPFIPPMRELLQRLARDPHAPEDKVCALGECGKSLARASGIVGLSKPLTHHDLRHLFATRCIEAGVAIQTVSHWLGHSDGGALAMKVYGHLRNDYSSEMAQRVTF
jgi:integrase